MRRLVALIAVLALGALAPASAAADGEPNLVTERVYFSCGEAKLANLGAVTGEETVGWTTDQPAASVTEGAGCGHLNSGHAGDASLEAQGTHPTFTGTFTGNLDTLTIHLYAIDTLPSRDYEDLALDVTLWVDDWDYVFAQEVIIDRVSANSDVTGYFEVSITDIGLLAEADDTEHEVRLTVSPSFYANADQVLWVWDTTEVPSGITFNTDELADAVIDAW